MQSVHKLIAIGILGYVILLGFLSHNDSIEKQAYYDCVTLKSKEECRQ